MTDRKIERSDGRCFGQQQPLTNSIEIFISNEKNSLLPDIYKALKLFDSWTESVLQESNMEMHTADQGLHRKGKAISLRRAEYQLSNVGLKYYLPVDIK